MALEPLKTDLDVNHPLFVASSVKNVFQTVWKERARKSDDGGGKMPAKRARIATNESENIEALGTLFGPPSRSPRVVSWVEILCQSSRKQTNGDGRKTNWIHVDPSQEVVNQPDLVEALLFAEREGILPERAKKKLSIAYALAAEHVLVSNDGLLARMTDVTPRYASSWIESLKARGVLRGKQTKVKEDERVDNWWSKTLKSMNDVAGKADQASLASNGKTVSDAIVLNDSSDEGETRGVAGMPVDLHLDDVDLHEKEQLAASAKDEPLPTSKTAFKSHPIYVIPSCLTTSEMLVPDAKKRICGVFKGELVYRRTDVQSLLPARKWLYKGRKVKESELGKPIKRIKKRKKPIPKGFNALKSYGVGGSNDGSEQARSEELAKASRPLDDGMEEVYASWQTDQWSPAPVGPDEPIPVNEFKNVELRLLNPGLCHIDEPRIAIVAKQLGIPYAPCLLGFEGHGGNTPTPCIRGIVVHQLNEEILREAHVEMASQFLEQSHEDHQRAVYGRWKKLLVGMLTKDRLEREYGDE
jgi:xeroderma pigmentosum group C-complementing protein